VFPKFRENAAMSSAAEPSLAFSEKAFYLSEFRSRTLALAVPSPDAASLPHLDAVLRDFSANSTRVILVSDQPARLAGLVASDPVSVSNPGWVGALWRALRNDGRALLGSEAAGLAELCRHVSLRLGLAKLVWVEGEAVLARPDGSRLSFLNLADLEALLASDSEPRADAPLLEEVRQMIAGGLPSVSICAPERLADELFTYAGSGTFFTRERAPLVRTLMVDDFDPAHDLVRNGVEEGYLVERSASELEVVLSNGFGVFIEGRYLAGIGALIPHEAEQVGEIASLYTLTRFLGEGVGGHLVRFALERAQELGYRFVFACTTSERVEGFFLRHGFRTAAPDEIPAEKWKGYPHERRPQVRCVLHSLGG
jgi:N-acetylglutamate synthase-like GNAT family acetyltransferase